MRKRRVSLAMRVDQVRELDRWAKLQKRSRSAMLELALDEWLENARVGKAVLENPAAMQGLLKLFTDREVVRSFASAMGEELSERDFQKLQGLFAGAKLPGSDRSGKGGV